MEIDPVLEAARRAVPLDLDGDRGLDVGDTVRLKLVVADSAAKPNDAVQAEQRFITENKAILMTGSTSSAVAVALNKLAQREKVLYVAGISGSEAHLLSLLPRLRERRRGEVGGIQASTLLLDQEGREVRIGDRLIPVDAQPYDLQFFPHPPRQQFKYGRARIIAVADMLTSGGPHDVVALSVGAREGVDNGTVFSIWRVGSSVTDKVRYGADRTEDSIANSAKVRLPDEFAGHVMVFRTFDKVSYGLVMDAIKPSRVGYELKHPDAAY